MTDAAAPEPRPGFPWWIVLGGLVLALGYLPTLNTPFDFIDDGNLVYPAPAGTTFTGHVARWWDKVRANVEHLGPFRPVLWVHWEVSANLFGGDPLLWRTARLLWCGLAAGMLLWLLRELKAHPTAALLAGAAAMWNPYRNEIWTSLTLAEGVAMPYAMLALIGARKAGASSRPWAWHLASLVGLLGALGCKNVFVALIPAQMALRLWPDGVTLRDGWRQNRGRAALYLLPLFLPIAHFVYFKLNWHPGQYRTPGPSFEQAGRIASWLKGAAGADFLGAGLALVVGALLWHRRGALREALGGFAARYRAALLCAALLIAAGVAIYLPMPMMAARYTMPAVWGVDILIALALTAFAALPLAWPTRVAWAGVAVGLAALMVANVGRQEKFAARARMLWDTLHYVEQHAPPDARVAWVGGESGAGALNVEEGIHFQWHLFHRGRGDVRIGLVDEAGQPVERVELPPLDAPPLYRIAASDRAPERWQLDRAFASSYRLGRKQFVCHLETVRETEPPPLYIGPRLAAFMKEQFDGSRLGAPDSRPDGELLRILTANGKSDGQRPTAEAKRPLP